MNFYSEEDLFWINDEQWEAIRHFFTQNNKLKTDPRRTLSGIAHVLLSGCDWSNCPLSYGRRGIAYQTFWRWRHRPFWKQMVLALAEAGWVEEARALDPVAMTMSRPARHGKRIDKVWRDTNREWIADRTKRAAEEAKKWRSPPQR